ncbi:unnamed protein product [Didymodactylos carnosus]|uniref:Uncharacterized protein n=1 Tax=Didymodactylos carnosus TaxID=1234261 RepID=A0A815C8W1_9BILA|nr:unnamed protein product [Didymodactylos carnosus]CAF1279665.1 unnamed protein product [Didymodactylos carnosus]CAF3772328.1 unnamed protein product [Didymodactylos carnosus]CAF4074029.1 unnamed protein product [Didymodactylos carnosus]
MMRSNYYLLFFLCISSVEASHFRGGAFSYKPSLNTTTNSTVDIIITQSYSWLRTALNCYCNTTSILNHTSIGDYGTLTCISSSDCGGYSNNVLTQVQCKLFCDIILSSIKFSAVSADLGTDFSTTQVVSTGRRSDKISLTMGAQFILGYQSSCWLFLQVVGTCVPWSIVTYINLQLRPDGNLNTPPVSNILSVIAVPLKTLETISVPMADGDNDYVRCRWASNNKSIANITTTTINECGGVCQSLPNSTLFSPNNNCTLLFQEATIGYYAVALQIEDFYTSSSVVPLSSVPLQFLIYIYAPSNSCILIPTILNTITIIYVEPNVPYTGQILAQANCNNTNISDFLTTSPIGMLRSSVVQQQSSIYSIDLSWTPTDDQFGPQVFCCAAIDSYLAQSQQFCITFIVGVFTTTAIATTSQSNADIDWLPLKLGLGLGLPIVLLSTIATCCYWLLLSSKRAANLQSDNNKNLYRQQYIRNENELERKSSSDEFLLSSSLSTFGLNSYRSSSFSAQSARFVTTSTDSMTSPMWHISSPLTSLDDSVLGRAYSQQLTRDSRLSSPRPAW